MFRLMIIAAVAVAALASTLVTPELDEQWESFKDLYNKQYGEQEHLMRRLIWESNLRYIQKHNLDADKGLHTYILGENEYSDMTHKEFVSVMNGYIMPNGSKKGDTFMAPIGVELKDVPTSVDWRTKGYVTEVKNQGQCGSCWAFSTTGSLEGQTFKKTQKLVSLSEQNLVDCSSREGNKGCQGGLMDNGFTYIKVNDGIDTEQSYPYRAKTGLFCRFKKADVGATDTGYVDIKRGSEDELQMAVATVGPISVAMDAGHPSFQHYKTGVYSEKQCSSSRLDHGVLAVGYGTSDSSEDYWIVKNSWGTTWGMKGYFEMSRNKENMCGIATQASYPKV
ncbi:procathepsin L-like [Mytilus californianus]|uniref:procathepsin L-like n=1 Tax=Mytilus californianus TaxID=6549 RepID=UPI00224594A6|nr:procathepsin L-like [Mytilus californianus]